MPTTRKVTRATTSISAAQNSSSCASAEVVLDRGHRSTLFAGYQGGNSETVNVKSSNYLRGHFSARVMSAMNSAQVP